MNPGERFPDLDLPDRQSRPVLLNPEGTPVRAIFS